MSHVGLRTTFTWILREALTWTNRLSMDKHPPGPTLAIAIPIPCLVIRRGIDLALLAIDMPSHFETTGEQRLVVRQPQNLFDLSAEVCYFGIRCKKRLSYFETLSQIDTLILKA